MGNGIWLEPLLELQKIDIELQKLSEAIEQNPIKKQLLDDNLMQIKIDFDNAVEVKRQISIKIKEFQHEIETKEQNILNFKTKMGLIKDNVTYQKMLSEIEQVKGKISQLETDQLETMDEEDLKQIIVDKIQIKLNKQKELVNLARNKFEEDLKKFISQKEEKQICYDRLLTQVEESLLVKYQRIRQSLGGRRGEILVAIQSDKCGSCFFLLTAQDCINARKLKPKLTCGNCGSLIYHKNG